MCLANELHNGAVTNIHQPKQRRKRANSNRMNDSAMMKPREKLFRALIVTYISDHLGIFEGLAISLPVKRLNPDKGVTKRNGR